MPIAGWTEEDVFVVAERAHSLYLQGCYREAAAIFEGLIVVDPENRYCRTALAALYLALGEQQKALDQADQALALDDGDVEARARCAEARLALGRLDEAAADVRVLRSRQARQHASRLELQLEAARAKLTRGETQL